MSWWRLSPVLPPPCWPQRSLAASASLLSRGASSILPKEVRHGQQLTQHDKRHPQRVGQRPFVEWLAVLLEEIVPLAQQTGGMQSVARTVLTVFNLVFPPFAADHVLLLDAKAG